MRKPSLKKNAVFNMIRQSSSILISLLLLRYVTRTLGPENYGKYNYCVSIVSYFRLIASLGIGTYAIREISAVREDRERSARLASQMYTLNLCTMLGAYLCLSVFLILWRPGRDYLILTLLSALELFFETVSREWVFNVYEDFTYVTVRTVLFQLLRMIAIFLLVKKPEDVWIYALITLACAAVTGVVNRLHGKKYIRIGLTRTIDGKKHLPPILVIFVSSLVASIYLNSDLTMLGAIKGDAEVGIYRVATQIYSTVKAVINAVTVVMIPRMAVYANNGRREEMRELLASSFKTLSVLVLPALAGLYMISYDVILLLPGEAYAGAVTPARILSFALLFATSGNVAVSGVLVSTHREKQALLITALSALTNVALNVWLIPAASYVGAAWTTLIAEIIAAGLSLWMARDCIPFRRVFRHFAFALLGSCLVILACCLVERLRWPLTAGLLAKVALSALLYGLAMLPLYKEKAFALFRRLKH